MFRIIADLTVVVLSATLAYVQGVQFRGRSVVDDKRIFAAGRATTLLSILLLASPLFAQSGNASLTGFVQDSSKAFMPGVRVSAINTATNQKFETVTNKDGSYTIPSLPVGPYRLRSEKAGFQTIVKQGLFLHTQDVLQINLQMQVGSASETITVTGEENNINTTDAAVSTVIDRQFVQNIPLNGRSFQTLVLLSPGTVTGTPQISAGTPPSNDQGEYSVNGMRSDANNFEVDGASASNSPAYTSAAGSSGMLGSATALGTTQAMLQVDAMEEFRISTSTYSAEYGRQPGAQVSLRSRSGTNEYHGTLYDYLRNSAFDANNWFNTYSTKPLPKPAERQNDFGGTVGGPISVPHLFSGRDRAFLFFGYEGLRLTQPQAADIYYVPSNGTYNTGTYADPRYENLRANAPAALQPVLNAFPLPNCSTAINPQCVDYGLGGSPYLQTPTSTGQLNSINARIDYQLLPTMRLFARYNDATSSTAGLSTGGPMLGQIISRNRVYILGADNAFRRTVSNELRLQYSPAVFVASDSPAQIGGASPLDIQQLEGLTSGIGESVVHISLPNTASIYETTFGSQQFQPNATDVVTWSHGRHLFKFGVDYRQTTAYYNNGAISRSPYIAYGWTTASSILSNTANYSAENELRVDPTTENLGLFVQDEWHITPRLSLSPGLRWDLNPPPSVSGAQAYTYTGDINNPSTLAISARPGGAIYKTTYSNFAPRFGMALTIHNRPGHELVLRTGAGLFYDLIAINGFFGAGTGLGTAAISTGKTTFPLAKSQILVPVTAPKAPYTLQFYPSNNVVPPSALQWNVTLEQAFGNKQTVTMGYVASLARNLIRFQQFTFSKLNPNFSNAYMYINGPGSNYNSLQLRYQRQMSRALQVLAAYTWAHAIDWASTEDYNVGLPFQRGDSNFDVRHNFTAALVYNVPSNYGNRLERVAFGSWNTDLWFIARTAFPFEPTGPAIIDPITGDVKYGELNYNGNNPYVYKAGIPGGKEVDSTVFSVTSDPTGIGSAPRNLLRGFGEIQANVAIQREFPIYDRLGLQFRVEAFNIANHPNFGTVNTTCGVTKAGATCNNPIMGQATNTLSTGLGGLSSLYQQGGPRSLQLALKLQF
jgi:hypothetical protein